MTPLPSLILGFALGVRHATDADHIAAIATIAGGSGSWRRAARVGAAWGLGHSASVLLVGGLLVLLRLPMPPRLALAFEFAVALMLVALGVRSLLAHRHPAASTSVARPFTIGIVHGLAGSAVLALVVVGATASSAAAAVYLVCFCVGTVGGMAAVTAALAMPVALQPARALMLERGLRIAAGVASVGIGLAMAHRIGVRDGLFAAVPSWSGE